MKRLLLILILLLPRLAAAQSNSVNDFFSRYAAAEGFTSVQLEQKMMQLMSHQAAERGDKGLAVLLKDIQYIRIIALKEGDGGRFVRDAEAAAGGDFTQTKIPVIVRLRGSPSAQDRNNDILLRYTNKRKNVRIATYTHVFLCLNIILAEQTSR